MVGFNIDKTGPLDYNTSYMGMKFSRGVRLNR